MKANTKLVCASSINLNIISDSDIRIRLKSGSAMSGDRFTLRILEIFSSARSLQDGLDELLPKQLSSTRFASLVSHIQALYKAGILKDAGDVEVITSHNGRFDAPPVHIRMLNDEARTMAYQAAIREQVKSGDVVLDIGTGTGILAASAALAGAKKVYAVERSSMGALANKIFEANNLSDRVTVLQGHSGEVDLPEKADILVSEIIGNDPLAEAILSTTSDAVKRHLKPGAKIIPSHLDLFAQPYSIPAAWLNKRVFAKNSVAKWKKLYGLDFSPLLHACENQNHSSSINTYRTHDWRKLSDPVHLKSIEFENSEIPTSSDISTANTVIARQDGAINGILVYFNARLSPNVELDIGPDLATPQNHWASHVWIPGKPIHLCEGDEFELVYRYADNRSEFEIKIS